MFFLEQTTLERSAQILSDRHNVKIVMGDGPVVDLEKDPPEIHIPNVPDGPQFEELRHCVRGWLDHEIAHVVGQSHTPTIIDMGNKSALSWETMQILEDCRVDALMSEKYIGSAINLDRAFAHEMTEFDKCKGDLNRYQKAMLVCYMVGHGRANEVPNWLHESAAELAPVLEKVESIGRRATKTQDLIPLVKQITELLKDDTDPMHRDEKTTRERLVEQITATGLAGMNKTIGDNPPLIPDNHVCIMVSASEVDTLLGKLKIPYELQRPICESSVLASRNQFCDAVYEAGGPVRQSLQRLLQSEKRCYWEPNKRSGKVAMSRVHQIATGAGDGRVMESRVIKEAPDTACTLLIDVSGSMYCGGTPIVSALIAGAAFADVISAAGHKAQVVLFGVDENHFTKQQNDLGRYQIHLAQLKRWNEPGRRVIDRVRRSACMGGGGTPMGEAMYYCARELCSMPEQRRVLMVFGDGAPSNRAAVRSICREATEAGIEVCLFGIDTTEMESLHHNTMTLPGVTAASLSRATIEKLRDMLQPHKV